VTCSPTSSLVCSPPTPCLRRPRLRFPLPVAYLVASACSVPYGRRHVRPPTCRASETGHRLSARPGCLRGEARASQVTGPSSSCVPWSNTPPDTFPSSPEKLAGDGCCLQGKQDPRHPGSIGFGAACPMAHTFACLRIAEAISDAGARLATGAGGLTLGRAGFAPAGRHTKFHGVISASNSL
jgi:hypothetical protein